MYLFTVDTHFKITIDEGINSAGHTMISQQESMDKHKKSETTSLWYKSFVLTLSTLQH